MLEEFTKWLLIEQCSTPSLDCNTLKAPFFKVFLCWEPSLSFNLYIHPSICAYHKIYACCLLWNYYWCNNFSTKVFNFLKFYFPTNVGRTKHKSTHIGKLIGLWWEGGHVCNHVPPQVRHTTINLNSCKWFSNPLKL